MEIIYIYLNDSCLQGDEDDVNSFFFIKTFIFASALL